MLAKVRDWVLHRKNNFAVVSKTLDFKQKKYACKLSQAYFRLLERKL